MYEFPEFMYFKLDDCGFLSLETDTTITPLQSTSTEIKILLFLINEVQDLRNQIRNK